MTSFEEFRSNGIGGSDAPIIMGVSKFKKTMRDLWTEKVNGISLTKDNFAMKRGREMEGPTRKMVEKSLGFSLDPVSFISPERSWLRGNLDGYNPENGVALEIKHAGIDDHFTAVQGKVPVHYYPQLQHYMAVLRECGQSVEKMVYASANNGAIAYVDVYIDEPYIEEMLKKEKEFWDLVETCTPPEDERASMSHMREWTDLENQLEAVRRLMDCASEDEKSILDRMKELSEGLDCYGEKFSLTKITSKGTINWKRFQEDHPELSYEEYRKDPCEKWVARCINKAS